MRQDMTENLICSPRMKDYFDLWMLKLAKLRRVNLSNTDEVSSKAYYETFFEEKDYIAYANDPRMQLRRDIINHFLVLPDHSSVLDVGCGLGDVLNGLTGHYRLFGVDFSEENVKATQHRLKGRASIEQGSACEMPYENASMDAALCLEVLEHLPDDIGAVREIARVLKPGGLFISSVPSAFYWPEYKQLMGHLRHYTKTSFTQLLEDNGFVVEHYLPTHPNWHRRFMRGYFVIRFAAATLGMISGKQSIYEFCWPFQKQTAIERLAKRIDAQRVIDQKLDYSQLSTSTFVLARRQPNG